LERGRPSPRVPATLVRADEGVRAPADGKFMVRMRDFVAKLPMSLAELADGFLSQVGQESIVPG